ncbi:MAG: rpsT [Verrucomicrobiaceae bacterium]|nr:rpsT [Verrucomicrobiaceae bacterium]
MANTRSAEKNIRKTKARTLRNQSTKSRVRTIRKRVLTAIEKGDIKTAEVELSAFASAADKAAKTNVIHKNAANRLKSRLSLQISAKAKAATAVAAK